MKNLQKLPTSKKAFFKLHFLKMLLFFLSVSFFSSTYAQSIVEEHGRLRVMGNKVVNQNNEPISLAGNSLFWSNFSEGAQFYNAQTVNHLASEWKTDIVRAAMGVEDNGGYISNPTREKNKVKAVVDAAINAGVYVIIDWHSHNAELYQSQAIAFFTEMAELYGSYDNVIYEVYNEPISQSWPVIKSYSEGVIDAIRAVDPDNLIVVGTRFYSQEVEEASNNPINQSNIAYTLHFYAGTHGQSLRNKASRAMNNGIALFVTEWGAVNANGDGGAAIAETNAWMNFLKDNDISHANWSVSDKAEGASIVAPNTGVSGLISNNLTATGAFLKGIIENWNDNDGGNDDDNDGGNDDDDDGGNDDDDDNGNTQTPFKSVSIPGTIQAEDYDNGGQNIAYYDADAINNGGAYRNDGVDIGNTSDAGGGSSIGWTENGEWLEYTIDSIAAGDYNITYRIASDLTNSKSLKATLDGTELGTVVMPSTGGWGQWENVTLNNVSISEGSDLVLRLDIIGGGYNLNWIKFEATTTNPPIDICDPIASSPLTDSDGDGLTDCEETSGNDNPNTALVPTGTSNPNDICDPIASSPLTDSDGDGLTDCEESSGNDNPNTALVPTGTSNPNDICDPIASSPLTDSDGDGLTDCEESSGNDNPNTALVPTGISNPNDICDPIASSPLTDSDGDGLTDCEESSGNDNPNTILIPTGSSDPIDPNDPPVDICDPIASSPLTDSDGDGLTDCEETSGNDNPNTALVPTGVSNPNDICDPIASSPLTDSDGDGLTDCEETSGNDNPNTALVPTGISNPNDSTDPNDDSDPTDPSGTCDSPTVINLPFANDGSGTFCFVTSGSVLFINSWGLETLQINGVDFTNAWSNNMPPRIDGNYYISYTSNNSWGHFEMKGSGGSARIANTKNSSILSMHPNPSKGSVNINLKTKPSGLATITFYNNIGRVIKKVESIQKDNSIDVSNFSSGMYFVKLKYDEKIIIKKLIKQ